MSEETAQQLLAALERQVAEYQRFLAHQERTLLLLGRILELARRQQATTERLVAMLVDRKPVRPTRRGGK